METVDAVLTGAFQLGAPFYMEQYMEGMSWPDLWDVWGWDPPLTPVHLPKRQPADLEKGYDQKDDRGDRADEGVELPDPGRKDGGASEELGGAGGGFDVGLAEAAGDFGSALHIS